MATASNLLRYRVIVQYCANGQYGEFTAKSTELDVQQMVDEMYRTVKPGISLRFFDGNGFIVPAGYLGDARLYIPAKVTL